MKVHVFHSSSDLYGSDRSLLALARGAARLGVELLVSLPADGPLAELLRGTGAHVVVAPAPVLRRTDLSVGGLWRLVCSGALVFREARSHAHDGPASVYLNNTSVALGGLVSGARVWGVPIVTIVREICSSRLERSVLLALTARCRLIVCVSDAVAAQFPRSWRSRIAVVPSGADLRGIVGGAPPADRSEFRVLLVGRINAWKGHVVACRAVASLRGRNVPVRLRVLGDEYPGSGTRADIERLIVELGIRDSVDVIGEVADVDAHYRWAHVVIAPSTRPEPFGKAIVESMSRGRPVIASNDGGPAEVVEHGKSGLLVETGDSESLASAIELLARERGLLEQMSQQASSRALMFDEDVAADRIMQLLRAAS